VASSNNDKKKRQWLFGDITADGSLPPDGHYFFGLGDVSKVKVPDLFRDLYHDDVLEKEHGKSFDIARVLAEPHFFWLAAKVFLGLNLYPLQSVVYQTVSATPYSILLGSRGFAKSFGLAVISMLKCILTLPKHKGGPGVQIVLVGSGFRQAKIIFSYVESLWQNAPVMRSLCSKNDGPKHEIDRFTFYLNGNTVTAIPLGSGEKVRGLRGNCIIIDEFNSINPAIFETVVTGFAAVSGSPIDNIEYNNKLKYLRSINQQEAAKELMDSYTVHRNQIILAGTSGYQFQPLYREFDKYRKFIEFGDDIPKLKQMLPNFDPPVSFNPKDCISSSNSVFRRL
jgi:hypothetical protein